MCQIARWRFWAWPRELRQWGVLGINRRNVQHVLPGNRRQRLPLVNDKLRTKRLCEAHGIPVPQTLLVVARHGEIKGFPQAVKDQEQFVLKPAGGSLGRGILVVAGRDGTDFVAAHGARLPQESIAYHLSAILAGLYHAAGQPDRALVEQRVRPHPVFQHLAAEGTPDIRVLLYRQVPVMAMLRLPTRQSQGRANLHQGGMAAGIDLRNGRTFGGIWRGRATDRHPDTGHAVAGLEIPCWDTSLSLAMKLADCLGLDYVGIDLLLDAARGPVVLEANARPGLAIQIANSRGLVPKLCMVDAHAPETLSPGDRRQLAALLAGSNGCGPSMPFA